MGLGQMAGKPALRRQAMLLRRGVATAAVPFPPSGSLAGFGSSHSRSHPSLRLSHYGSPRGYAGSETGSHTQTIASQLFTKH